MAGETNNQILALKAKHEEEKESQQGLLINLLDDKKNSRVATK